MFKFWLKSENKKERVGGGQNRGTSEKEWESERDESAKNEWDYMMVCVGSDEMFYASWLGKDQI